MKTLFFITTLYFVSFCCKSQELILKFKGRAIEDYSTLKKIIDDSTGKTKPDPVSLDSLYNKDEIEKFIAKEKARLKPLKSEDKDKITPQGSFNIPVTPVVDALGTFVANRIKEEANIAYLDKFTNYLSNDEFEEIKLLFPESRAYLADIKNNLYEYKSLLPSIRNNFKTDFNNINLTSFVEVFDKSTTFSSAIWKKTNIQENKKYFAFIFDLLSVVTTSKKPIVFLDEIRNKKYFQDLIQIKDKPESEIAFLITDFAFHSNHNNAAIDLNNLLNNESESSILCFKTLFVNSKTMNFKKWNETTINTLLPLFYKISKSWDDAPNKDKIYNFMINLGKILQESAKSVGIDNSKTKYFSSVTTVAQGIQLKDYNLLVNGIINLTVQLIDDKSKSEHEKLRKTLTFVSNLVIAKDGEEMLAALNAVALPVGSYMMKRNSKFTASLGALGGIGFYGNGLTSIYAPIGLNFSWGKVKGHNFGFTIPIVDVGAVTAIRLIGNKDPLPDLKWDNVLALGVIANWGIRNTPLTISAGYQNGPGLIKISGTNAIIAPKENRFVASLSFDIPILKIYRKE